MAISIYLTIITLNLDRLMPQSKDAGWLSGLESKTHLHAACKRLTSELKTHTDWK